ncbi:MAG: hypothetical protein K2P80_01175 [Beijerinckiaceae bacterium]|nr:hypothetical protein [Beijerinckiaceae bacterium]
MPLDVFKLLHRISSFFAIATAAVAVLTAISPAGAQTAPPIAEIGVSDAVIAEPVGGIALFGYDPVAYFTDKRAAPGKTSLTLTEGGLVWRFINVGNLEAFRAAPAAYVPLFGGYDPIDIAAGRLVAGDPEIFAILDDRLVLFRTHMSRSAYLEAASARRDAAAMWPQMSRALVRPRP